MFFVKTFESLSLYMLGFCSSTAKTLSLCRLTGLVNMVEETVRRERNRCPNKPIYIVGESLGACIAFAVAARNPDMDLVLILANPGEAFSFMLPLWLVIETLIRVFLLHHAATSFDKSPLRSLAPLLEIVPDQVQLTYPFLLSLMRGLCSIVYLAYILGVVKKDSLDRIPDKTGLTRP